MLASAQLCLASETVRARTTTEPVLDDDGHVSGAFARAVLQAPAEEAPPPQGMYC